MTARGEHSAMTECLPADVAKNAAENPPVFIILMCVLKDANRRFPKGMGPPVLGAREPGENDRCRERATAVSEHC